MFNQDLHDTVFHLDLRTGCDRPKEVGAIVMIGNNRGPEYEITAIVGDEAWVVPVGGGSGRAGLTRLERLRVVR